MHSGHSARAYTSARMQVGGGGLEKLGGDSNAYMQRIKELKEEMSSGTVRVHAMCGTLCWSPMRVQDSVSDLAHACACICD